MPVRAQYAVFVETNLSARLGTASSATGERALPLG